jgi:hypothetical protein
MTIFANLFSIRIFLTASACPAPISKNILPLFFNNDLDKEEIFLKKLNPSLPSVRAIFGS